MPSPSDALLQALAADDFAAVERCARQLIASRPDYSPAWHALGVAALRHGRVEEAIEALNRAIALGGDGAALRFELASALEQAGRRDEAVAHLRHAAVLDPQSGETHINLTALLEKLDHTDEALQCGRRAIALCPENPIPHFNLASVLQSLGQLDEAIAAYSKAIDSDPNFALAYTNRGCCRLLQNDYAAGWSDYEWRLKSGKVEITNYPQPRWDGKKLVEGTLLVHGEQGVGDEILFASCLPEMVPLVGKCVLACDPRLARLIARSFPAVAIVAHARQPGGSPPQLPFPITSQIPSGSLPLHLRKAPQSFPNRKRFLLADAAQRRVWRNRFDTLGPGLKVGISWRGGGTWEERRRRTTTLDQWRDLFGVQGVQFINLQYGDCDDELANAATRLSVKIHNFAEADPLADLDPFAAKIAALDLVISIGNANVHLAGALGVPTWCLLPFVPQWRWGLHGETTPWYPGVRLIRQSQPGDWATPLTEATQRLRELVSGSKPSPLGRGQGEGAGCDSDTLTPTLSQREREPVLMQKQQFELLKPAAKTTLQQATATNSVAPPTPAILTKLLEQAIELFNQNRFEEAGSLAEQILDADANNVNALRIVGVAARKAQQLERASELLARAADLAPENGALHFEQGVTLMEQNRQREAFECFQRTVKVKSSFQPAYVNLSAILEQQERFEEALQWARKAAELNPDCPLAHYNLANSLRECGRVAEATTHYERAAQLKPDYPKAGWNLGICRVLLGRFAEAWPLFELREVAEEVKLDKFTQPRWDGTSLAGKTIAIHAEQGIGDEVLFASCFQDVISQAKKTILVCEPRLAKLFARSFPGATVHGWTRRKDWSPMPLTESIDYQIPAGSLPLYLRNTPESFPRRERFLTPDAELVRQWCGRFEQLGPGLKIGLSWRAGGKANEGRKRTIPLLEWREILKTAGVHFINLQYSDASDDLAAVERELGVRIHDWEQGDPLLDMDSYAAKIAALDLVISVGNAAVHLSGAVGTTAWTLLPRVPSWRWMVTGEVSPWYSSVRLFRQPSRRRWAPVLTQIAERLQEAAEISRSGISVDQVRAKIRAIMPRNEPPEAASLEPSPDAADTWLDANELGNRQPLKVIQELQDRAEAAVREGRLGDAENLYREILSVTPRHLKSHVGLGLIARETGRTDLAIRSLQRALNLYEPHPANHAHLAAALTDSGRVDEALAHARRAVALDAKYPPAQLELGRALQAAGQHAAAIEAFHRSLQMSPGDAMTIATLSRSLIATGRIDEAISMLRQSIAQAPAQTQLNLALGEALLEDQCLDEAEQCLRKAIALKPTLSEAHFHLARLLHQRGRLEEAIAANRQAIEHRPQSIATLLQLAAFESRRGAFGEAEIASRRAVELRPESAELHTSLGTTLANQGRHDEALAEFDRALAIRADQAPVHVQRALSLLQSGRLAEGWDEYEWRLKTPQSTWDGSSLKGKIILIRGEHNIAEQIMFATCIPDVLRDAAKCVVVCSATLEPLFRRSFPQATVFGVPPGSENAWRLPPQLKIDVQCAAGSLPRLLRRSAEAFSKQPQLLIADPAKVAHWRERIAAFGAGMKIGIAWRSDFDSAIQPSRVPPLADWQPVLTAPGIRWISLQQRQDSEEIERTCADHNTKIHDWSDTSSRSDLDSIAAKIAALDLVITADNTIAHLAGALGVPTWVVLAQPPAWHWLSDREQSLWYESVRLFRPDGLDKPRDLFRQLREELLKTTFRLDEESKIGPPHASWSQVRARIQQ